jgi:GNAT superfamily N-acetyltransferase
VETYFKAHMPLSISAATYGDAACIAALQTRVAEDLTRRHGVGHWSAPVSEQNVARGIASSTLLIGRHDGVIVGTLRLVTKKPWAIDPAYFAAVRRPLYLLSMAVEPSRQRTGIGRRLLDEARVIGKEWPADAIRLDAYDNAAGAGPFYAKCGYREVGRVTYRSVPLKYFELLL